MKLTTYEAVYSEDTQGVFAISLVENPATQEFFIQLSEDKKKEIIEKAMEIQFATANEEKRLLVGLVLEPDVPIYRNQDGEEFNIVFNAETIQNLAHGFFINGFQNNSTIEHTDEKIAGVTFVESWIVDDPKRDKSNVYNLEYAKGSWIITMKVTSDEVWNDYVKTGKVKGFSIDAAVKLKKTNTKTEVKMTLIEKLKQTSDDLLVKLGLKQAEIKLGQIMMEGGEITFEYEGEVLEAGVNIYAIDPQDEATKIPVPVGTYPLEDGSVLKVENEGVVASVDSAAPADPPADPPAPPVEAGDDSEAVQQIKSILIKYEEKLNDMTAKFTSVSESIEGVKTEVADIKKEVLEFSARPSRAPRTVAPNVKLDSKGRLLEALRNQEN